jgi:hypothetical protein
MNIDYMGVIKDGIIVFVLSFLGGFIVGIYGSLFGLNGLGALLPWIGVSNLICVSAGFWYVSRRARADWIRLFQVAIVVQLISLINLPLGFNTPLQWATGFIYILVFMAIGGFADRLTRKA